MAAVKKVYLITDAQGNIQEGSENYKALGMNDPNLIRAVLQSPGADLEYEDGFGWHALSDPLRLRNGGERLNEEVLCGDRDVA